MKELELKNLRRWRRHRHIRKKLIGTAERPRLNVFRSLKHIYCQLIDDQHVDKNGNPCGKTLVACSSVEKSLRGKIKHGGNVAAARIVGEEMAKLAKAKGIQKVAFDRGGYLYHGRVKALAESARQNGLQF